MSRIAEFRQQNRLAVFISKFANSFLYPAVFAIVCAISGVSSKDVYIPCFFILTALTVIAGIFSTDLKVFFPPAIIMFYGLGLDVSENYYKYSNPQPKIAFSNLVPILLCGVIIVAILLWRLISDKHLKEMLTKRGIFFWGFVLITAALLIGGLFCREWNWMALFLAALIGAFFLIFYMLFTTVLSHSNDGIAYLCKTLVCLGFAVSAQILTIACRLYENKILFHTFSGEIVVNRGMLATSWGVATIIGATLVPPIIAALYLMRNRRFPVLSLACALALWAMTVFITTRSAILVGSAALVTGLIFCVIGGKNKKINRICCASLAGLGIIAVVVFIVKCPDTYRSIISKVMSLLRFDMHIETEADIDNFLTNRLDIWKLGWQDFLSSPIFGKGFMYGYFDTEMASSNLFTNMYHNIFVQFLASTGIVGTVLLLIHFKQIVEVFFRRFDLDKFMLLLVPLSILAMSLVDNFFFYPNFIIIYVAFLAAAEIHLEQRRLARRDNIKIPAKDRKPRVVFTYVEAGKGHIIPTRNVCECFKRKYGDKTEVVESKFFTETGDANLEKTEKLFAKAVKDQNRTPIISFLCKLGNLLAGDTFALQVLLRMTISGKKTNPRAVKHIEELDADIIYTAHWSIPFYVNQLKKPHPYTICFCPDAYSNGAFNVDCNNFLISSDVGYNQTERMRMYAGGNVTLVPFPMRPEAASYRVEGKKEECRAKLGIPNDEFVVVLCDGGYGMAKLEKTVKHLLKSNQKMTVLAMCGTNHELYERLCERAKTANGNVRLIPVDFTNNMLDYLVCADIFAGKSGANSTAEPANLHIPIIVTKCITYIERGIKNYYVHKIKGAMYIPSSHLAARKIRKFAKRPELLEKYKKNLAESTRQNYDAEASADLIWQRLNEIGKLELD